ncbi:MAG: ABC transporter substrate-binding protein [Alphaproteobacteria bacterium]|nr:ABC transporter substrate-binding protein [Alphaproteobacteria bacterium]
MDRVQRRQVVCGLIGAVVGPAVARAEPGRVARIGMLVPSLTEYRGYAEDSFDRGMRERGWEPPRNCAVLIREYRGKVALVPELARELVRDGVDVVVAFTLQVALAAQSAAKATLVVAAGDPVSIGAAASLARPGGTITGMSLMAPELAAKRVDLLAEIVPHASRIAVLQNPDVPMTRVLVGAVQTAAQARGLAARAFLVRDEDEILEAFDAIKAWSADGIVLLDDELFFRTRTRIAAAALARKLPLACPFRLMAHAGCLFSYSASLPEQFYRAASYVDKTLKGANPAELPFEQPTRFELVVNLKTAAALGLEVPTTLLVDEVIE